MSALPAGEDVTPSGAARSGRYDDDFRRYAVELATAPGARVADVARELGVSASTLRRWLRAADVAPVMTAIAPPAVDATTVSAEPGPALAPDGAPPLRVHPGDDVFPALSALVPAYRFPIILAGLVAAVLVSTVVPSTYAMRPAVVALHVLSLVLSLGAVLVIDWHGLLWLAGRRGLTESTRLAAAAGPLIWGGLAGLLASGALLHPDLSSPLTDIKLVLVLTVAWNGAAMSALRRRLARLPPHVMPADLARRDWQLMMTATVVSQIGWWGAVLIGFVKSSA
ncbi:MAG: transposase [Humibacillus sp.]